MDHVPVASTSDVEGRRKLLFLLNYRNSDSFFITHTEVPTGEFPSPVKGRTTSLIPTLLSVEPTTSPPLVGSCYFGVLSFSDATG